MKKKIIIIAALFLAVAIFIGILGADRRYLINVLEARGYTKCGDGLFRMREIQQKGSEMIVIERLFDVDKNYGESHIINLYQRADGKSIKDSEYTVPSMWDFKTESFIDIPTA